MAKTLLVVDDSRIVQAAVRLVLEAEGYRIASGMNGAEGLRRAKELRPDLVLLDRGLPEAEAERFVQQLRRDPELAGTSVLLLHAASQPPSPGEPERLGVSAVLGKPFQSQALVDTVQAALQRPAPPARVAPAAPPAAPPPGPSAPSADLAARISRIERALGGAKPSPSPAPETVQLSQERLDAALRSARAATPRADAAAPAPASPAPPAATQAFAVRAAAARPQAPPVAAPVAPPETRPVLSGTRTPPIESLPMAEPAVTGGRVLSRQDLLDAVRQVAQEAIERAVWELIPDLAERILWEVVPQTVEALAQRQLDEGKVE